MSPALVRVLSGTWLLGLLGVVDGLLGLTLTVETGAPGLVTGAVLQALTRVNTSKDGQRQEPL
jgi:hypothetical protein